MKLKKIVRHISFLADAILVNENGKEVWKGSVVALHAAADTPESREHYLRECEEDGDYKAIREVEKALKYMNRYLDTRADYEAIEFKHSLNEYGVDRITVIFNIKKKEKKES